MMDVNPPPRHRPRDLAGYLEALSRPVFQAGMSWRVIDAKWEGIRDAFARFDPPAVADFGPADIERLLADPGIVRSRAKIEATIDNAQALLELDAEYGGSAGTWARMAALRRRWLTSSGSSGSSATAAPITSCMSSASRCRPMSSGPPHAGRAPDASARTQRPACAPPAARRDRRSLLRIGVTKGRRWRS